MTVGVVYYLDDPLKGVFRKVFPVYAQGETDAVLDDPRWTTEGLDPNRTAVLVKMDDVAASLVGTVPLPAPVVSSPII